MSQTEKAVRQNQAARGNEVIGKHKECGGELRCLTKEPVMAGKPGNCYIVYQCSRCGEIVLVG